VLLVEDDPSAAELVKAFIESEKDSFHLFWVDRLHSGLERLSAGGIDLVLLDFNLPDSKGIATFLAAKTQAPQVAIIPLTGSGDERLGIQAIQQGAQDYLFKSSINRDLLIRSMRYAIERKRSEEALRRAHDELEQRVRERTAELSGANAQLIQQISERLRAEAELRRLSNRLVEVQEQERRNLARELHDEIGQLLTGLKLALEFIALSNDGETKDSLERPQSIVNELMGRVRNMSLDLRPVVLDDLGLLHALLWLFERYTKQTNVRVTFVHSGVEGQRLDSKIETAAYRIIQEALTNVSRYAGVDEVEVSISADAENLIAEVIDRGKGFFPGEALASGSSSGLMGIRERAQLVGGALKIDSAPGAGTKLTATLPLGDNAETADLEDERVNG
jgi:signal transduction histidine kinase